MKEFIEELKYNQNINFEKGLENRVDIDYVIERLESINLLESAYINEIECFIDNENEYDSVKANEGGVLDYLESLTDEDIKNIANNMINEDWLNEKLNESINDNLYHYKKWWKEEIKEEIPLF